MRFKAEISNIGFDYFSSLEKAISDFCKVADVYPVVLAKLQSRYLTAL